MSSAAWDNDDKRQGSQQDDRWEGWETVPSKKDNTKRGKHSNMMEAPVAGELPDLEKVNCEGNIHGGKASGRSKKDSKNSNKRVDKQSNSSFELDASDLSIMVLSDEEALEKLPGLLNEFILSKCESNDNCRKTDFDGTAREALQRISFLQALQAIEHFAGSVSARIQKRPAYLMGILRGQEQHWDKSRAAANLPGGSGELLALAPTVLVAIAEICMRGNCLPSDFTPEVCLSLHRLTPVLACKAVLAFNSNKRIVAGTRGGVLNRPRFFQRLIQNVAEQNLLALQSGAEASSSPDGSTTVSAASTPTNSSAGSTSTRSLPSPRGSGRKSSGMKMSSRTTSESNTPPMTPERKSKNAQKREESPINVTEKEASNEQVADNASSLDQNAWTSPLANSIGLKPGQKPWDENSSHSQPQQEPGPFDDGRNTSENPGGNLKDAYYFENKRNSPNAEERNTQSGASSQDQSWFGMSTENGNSDDQQPQGGFFLRPSSAPHKSPSRTTDIEDDRLLHTNQPPAGWEGQDRGINQFSNSFLGNTMGRSDDRHPQNTSWGDRSQFVQDQPSQQPQSSHVVECGPSEVGWAGNASHLDLGFPFAPFMGTSTQSVAPPDENSNYAKQIHALTEKLEKHVATEQSLRDELNRLHSTCQQLHDENLRIKTKHQTLLSNMRQMIDMADATYGSPSPSPTPSQQL